MADYNKLNNVTPSKIDLIFIKNKDIKEAILELVRTAYYNHHIEEKERRKKLYECLKKRGSYIIKQLSDSSFKENLKDEINSTVKEDSGFSKEIQTEIIEELEDTIEDATKEYLEKKKDTTNKVSTKYETLKIDIPDNNTLINKLFNNQKFVDNLTKFTKDIIDKKQKNRLKLLDKIFNTETIINNTNKSESKKTLINSNINILRNKNKILEEKDKNKNNDIVNLPKIDNNQNQEINQNQNNNLLDNVKRQILGNIDIQLYKQGHRTLTYLFKTLTPKRLPIFSLLKKMMNPKAMFKFAGKMILGPFKLVSKIITGGIFGIFSGIFGIFKSGINIIKTSFNVVKDVVSSIKNVSKIIIKGLGKLTVSFFKKIRRFIFSPIGAYTIGFIAGWVYGKIKNIYKGIEEKIENIKEEYTKKVVDLWGKLKENKFVKAAIDVATASEKMVKLREYMCKATKFLKNFSWTKAIASFGGGILGSFAARLVVASIGVAGKCGPWGALIAGGIIGLGYIAGDLIGQWIGEVPERKNSEEYKAQNLLFGELTKKYRKTSKKNVYKKQHNIIEEIKQIDEKIDDLGKPENLTDEKKEKLAKLKEEKGKLSSALQTLVGPKKIYDETLDERAKHEKYINRLIDLLETEENFLKIDDLSERNQSIFPDKCSINEPFNLTLDNFFKNFNNGATNTSSIDNSSENAPFVDKRRYKYSLGLLSLLKSNAIQAALNSYHAGNISFSQIERIANDILQNSLDTTTINKSSSSFTVGENSIGENSITARQYFSSNNWKDLQTNQSEDTDGYGNTMSDKLYSFEDFKSLNLAENEKYISRQFNTNIDRQSIAEELKNNFINDFEKKTNHKLSDEQKEIIETCYLQFLIDYNISNRKSYDYFFGNDKNQNILNSLNDNIINILFQFNDSSSSSSSSSTERQGFTFSNFAKMMGVSPEELKKLGISEDQEFSQQEEIKKEQEKNATRLNEEKALNDKLNTAKENNIKAQEKQVVLLKELLQLKKNKDLIITKEKDQEKDETSDAQKETEIKVQNIYDRISGGFIPSYPIGK